MYVLEQIFESVQKKNWPQYLEDYTQFDQRGSYIQCCSAGAKNFTNYVFCHPQSNGVIQNIENRCAILTPICLCRLLSK